MVMDLGEHAHGIDSPVLRDINRLLVDYDPNLGIRRIPNDDPRMPWAATQNPPHTHGVWEMNVGHGHSDGISNWVFTFNEHFADERIFARVVAGDMKKRGVPDRVADLKAFTAAQELAKQKKMLDSIEERRDEMEAIGRLAQGKSTLRHKIRGEDYILGDTLRPVRTHIS